MSGEEKHEDGRGSKQLQIVHQGDQKIIKKINVTNINLEVMTGIC